MVLVKGFCLLVEVQLIFNAMFITAVQQSDSGVCVCVCVCVYSFKKNFFSIMVCHRILRILLCVIQ